ncbi:MAG: serine hydrolase, partial [Sphingobacteriales bacterium]
MRFIFLLLFIPSLVSAQTFQKEKLDSLLSRLDRNGKFMGSLVLYKDGALLYQQTIGYVDSIGGRKSDIHTKYRIGSITKTFTAVLVMKAMEQGKLSLD